MGASSAREQLESKMLKLKLRRIEIKQERIERVNQLEKITGKEIIREPIPDYIDHSEDEINPEDYDEEEEIEEEIIHTKHNKKHKKSKRKKKYEEDEEEEDDDSEYDKKVKKKLNKSKTKKDKKYKSNSRQVTKQ